LSSGQSNGSYTLILGEEEGRRKLPIIIGSFEAQAIAIEIEKIVPFRPMTHDLFMAFCKTFNIIISEVEIYNLVDGVFHAKLVCEMEGEVKEIDARTSDSIALAVRFKCPIYTYEDIMETAGVVFSDDVEAEAVEQQARQKSKPVNDFESMSVDQLNKLLEESLQVEDYGKAAQIRDEISKRKRK
jgi:bifunctional DNase/RNase